MILRPSQMVERFITGNKTRMRGAGDFYPQLRLFLFLFIFFLTVSAKTFQ